MVLNGSAHKNIQLRLEFLVDHPRNVTFFLISGMVSGLLYYFRFELAFTPSSAEQTLRGMELQEKKGTKGLKHI